MPLRTAVAVLVAGLTLASPAAAGLRVDLALGGTRCSLATVNDWTGYLTQQSETQYGIVTAGPVPAAPVFRDVVIHCHVQIDSPTPGPPTGLVRSGRIFVMDTMQYDWRPGEQVYLCTGLSVGDGPPQYVDADGATPGTQCALISTVQT